MTDRERLIELLKKTIYPKAGVDPAEVVADYLIDNGVIVSPCKVGDKLYYLRTWHSGRKTIHTFEAPDWDWIMEHLNDFGKTIFISQKEAEKALKERSNTK